MPVRGCASYCLCCWTSLDYLKFEIMNLKLEPALGYLIVNQKRLSRPMDKESPTQYNEYVSTNHITSIGRLIH